MMAWRSLRSPTDRAAPCDGFRPRWTSCSGACSGCPGNADGSNVPHHPEVWSEICGRYVLLPPGDLRGRLAMAGGLEILVRGGRPMMRMRMPIPAMRRGLPLQPVEEDDPLAFRLDLSPFGMGEVRLRFGRRSGTGRKVMHTDLGGQPISFVERQSRQEITTAIDRLTIEDQLMLAHEPGVAPGHWRSRHPRRQPPPR